MYEEGEQRCSKTLHNRGIQIRRLLVREAPHGSKRTLSPREELDVFTLPVAWIVGNSTRKQACPSHVALISLSYSVSRTPLDGRPHVGFTTGNRSSLPMLQIDQFDTLAMQHELQISRPTYGLLSQSFHSCHPIDKFLVGSMSARQDGHGLMNADWESLA